MATKRRPKAAAPRKKAEKAPTSAAKYQPPDIVAPSICLNCAKHPSLKKFIKANGTKGNHCGICHRTDQIASDPAKFEALSNLVKSLVRFYYDEFAYNPHWGGHDHVANLLCEPNDIVEHEAAPGFPRSEEDLEELRVSLFEDAYPDYDKGVGVYAGHDPVIGRMALNAIRGRRSSIYSRIEERLKSENYFEVEKEFKRHLAKFGPALSATIPPAPAVPRRPDRGTAAGPRDGQKAEPGWRFLFISCDRHADRSRGSPAPSGTQALARGLRVKERHSCCRFRRDRHR